MHLRVDDQHLLGFSAPKAMLREQDRIRKSGHYVGQVPGSMTVRSIIGGLPETMRQPLAIHVGATRSSYSGSATCRAVHQPAMLRRSHARRT